MRAPVGHTCPDINQCIKWLDTAKSEIEYVISAIENGDEVDYAGKALNALGEALKYIDIKGELEDLRSANSALRDWGYELSNELEKLKSEL